MTARECSLCKTILVQLCCHLIVHLIENRAWLEIREKNHENIHSFSWNGNMYREIQRWRREGNEKQTVGYNGENPFPLYNFDNVPFLYIPSQL